MPLSFPDLTPLTPGRWRVAGDNIWVEGEPIAPVAIPVPAGATGEVVYSTEHLPPGIVLSQQSLTLYGIPEGPPVYTSVILVFVRDDDSEAVLEFLFSVLPAPTRLVVPPVDPLVLHIGSPVDIQFPRPRGGSGNFAYALEYHPTGSFEGVTASYTALPEGLAFDAATGRLTGDLVNSPANRGESLAQLTMNAATRWGSRGNARDGSGRTISQFGGTRAPGTTTNPASFQYHFADGRSVTYTYRAIFDSWGGLRYDVNPDFTTEDDNKIPNNPELYILLAGRARPEPVPVRRMPFAAAVVGGRFTAIWQRDPAEYFEIPSDDVLYFEVVTNRVNFYDYVVRDTTTGVVVRRTFQLQLETTPATAPAQPVLQSQVVGANNWSGVLAPVDDPTIDSIWVANVGEGFPEPSAARRIRHDYLNREANQVYVGTGIQPGDFRRLFIYYRNAGNEFSTPLAVDFQASRIAHLAVPQIIRNLRLRSENNKLRAVWDPVDPYQQITGFDLTINRRAETSVPFATGATTSTVVPGLINDVMVEVGVRARNARGPGPWTYATAAPGDQASQAPYSYEVGGRAAQSRCQMQILVDVYGNGFNWLAVEGRAFSAEVVEGRAGRPIRSGNHRR